MPDPIVTQAPQVIINKMTQAQYDAITPSETELYLITDASTSVDIDNSTITKNTNDEIQTVGVIDSNAGGKISYWTGTRAQYDAITTKDANTLYNVTDNSNNSRYIGEIGQIIQSTLPLTDAGLHLLNGTLISGSGAYSAFVNYIASIYSSSTSCFCTEAEWQQSVTDYGVCGKFVYDSVNNTVRLPNLYATERYLIKSYSSGTDWYRVFNDGWCEQGGRIVNSTDGGTSVTLLKPYQDTSYTITTSGYITTNTSTASNNGAAKAAATYSDISTTGFTLYKQSTQPQADWRTCGYIDISDSQIVEQYEYIVIATTTKTDIEIDIDEVVTDLNGKMNTDMSNMSASSSAKATIMDWDSLDWSSVVDITSNATYTCPCDGYLRLYSVYNGYIYYTSNLDVWASTFSWTYNAVGASSRAAGNFFRVRKGEILTKGDISGASKAFFYPLKGAV